MNFADFGVFQVDKLRLASIPMVLIFPRWTKAAYFDSFGFMDKDMWFTIWYGSNNLICLHIVRGLSTRFRLQAWAWYKGYEYTCRGRPTCYELPIDFNMNSFGL